MANGQTNVKRAQSAKRGAMINPNQPKNLQQGTLWTTDATPGHTPIGQLYPGPKGPKRPVNPDRPTNTPVAQRPARTAQTRGLPPAPQAQTRQVPGDGTAMQQQALMSQMQQMRGTAGQTAPAGDRARRRRLLSGLTGMFSRGIANQNGGQ